MISPLTPTVRQRFRQVNETARNPLPQVGSLDSDLHSVSTRYGIDLSCPPFGTNLSDFFEVRELILHIEAFIEAHPPTHLESLYARIKSILKGPEGHAQKIAELGMILFYLDRPGQPFPSKEDSLVSFRAHEMANYLHVLVQRHQMLCSNNRIPSGKTHYLLQAFARMAMTSNQIGLVA